jgi:DNA-binding NtrC family response regulator
MTLLGKHILIVEDEYLIALDLANEIAASGAKVVGPAATIDAALAIADAANLDGAILDIDLGGKQTFSIADALAARQIPFVFRTGYMTARDLPARHAHVPFVEKPSHYGTVRQALEGAMRSNNGQTPNSDTGGG